MNYQKLTPEIGAIINDINLNHHLNESAYNKIYEILIENLVIIFKKTNITNQNHIKFAKNFL